MKKTLPLLLIFIFSLSFFQTVFAASNAEVYSDTIYTSNNSIFFVPVYIKNNPGIMGYKFTLKYDNNVLSYPNLSRGTISENGNFNDSIGVTNSGEIDVVWNSTTNVFGDGTLFIVSFNAENVDSTETKISITYSQEDTFNEKWENVKLSCSDITVCFKEKPSVKDESPSKAIGRQANDTDIIFSIETALDELNISNINDVSEEKSNSFIKAVNEYLSEITQSEVPVFSSLSELKDTYSKSLINDYVNDVLICIDTKIIDKSISKALKDIDEKAIDNVPPSKIDNFVNSFQDSVMEQNEETYKKGEKLNSNELLDAIISVNTRNSDSYSNVTVPLVQQSTKRYLPIQIKIIFAVAIAIIVVLSAFLIVKKRKTTN